MSGINYASEILKDITFNVRSLVGVYIRYSYTLKSSKWGLPYLGQQYLYFEDARALEELVKKHGFYSEKMHHGIRNHIRDVLIKSDKSDIEYMDCTFQPITRDSMD